jgi:cytidyltransferase-like protein
MEYTIIKQIHGGRVNKCFQTDKGFLKCYTNSEMYETEIKNLQFLSNHILIPKIMSYSDNKLLMEYISFSKTKYPVDYYNLGKQLTILHKLDDKPTVSYHGNIKIEYKWNNNWIDYFKYRLLMNLTNIPYDYWKNGMKLYDTIDRILTNDTYCGLCHGDINSGNWGVSVDGNVYIYDPTLFYGSYEYDIATVMCFDSKFDLEEFNKSYFIPITMSNEQKNRFLIYYYINHISSYNLTKNKKMLKEGSDKILNLIHNNTYPSLIPYKYDADFTILILFGTFNPIHNGHLDAFDQAIKLLNLDIKKVGGYVIASSDAKAKQKLSKKKYISFVQRVKMIKLAVENTPWSHCDLPSDEDNEHFGCLKYITSYYKNVIIVCGTDTYDFLAEKVTDIKIIRTERHPKISSTIIRSCIDKGQSLMKPIVYQYYKTIVK